MTRNYQLDFEISQRTDPLTKRDIRALTQGHTVRNPAGCGDGEFIVESHGSGSEYTVDLRRGACDCPDADGDGSTICKHQRAAQFATGARPIPPVALELDEIAVDVIRDGDNEIVDLDAVADYKHLALETDKTVTRRPRWATEDGEIVTASEPEPPEIGADIDAEREMVESQEQQAAADGGNEIARCGAECGDGSACENPVGDADRCHLHRDETSEQAEPEQVPEPEIDASESAGDVSEAFANVATTDGGAVIETDGSPDVLDRVFERADGDVTVIVINQ